MSYSFPSWGRLPSWGRFATRVLTLIVIAGIVIAGLLVVLPSGRATAAEVGERFDVGHWAGYAQYSDDGRDFSLCLISAEFDNGVALTFLRKGDGLAFFLNDPRWQLGQYDSYPMTVSVDRLWSQRVEGRAVLHSVVVDLGQDLRAWDALRRGHQLSVVTEVQRFSFVLDDSARALDRLEQCFRDHSGAVLQAQRNPFSGSANPFAAAPAPQTSPQTPPPTSSRNEPETATRRRPSMQLDQLSGLLERVVGVEFWVRPAAEVDASLDIDYIYGVGELLTGFYWEAFAEGRSAERILADALTDLQDGCSGPYVSGLRASVAGARGVRLHGSHACRSDDFFADATIIVWKTGYVTVFMNTTDMADAQVAEEIGTAVGTALVPGLSP